MSFARTSLRGPVAVALAAVIGACASPAAGPSASPSASPSSSATASPSAALSPNATPTVPPSPTSSPLGGAYTNFALGYRIELPGPWRRAECLSTRDYSTLPAGDSFVRVGEQDERATDVGYSFEAVSVSVEANPQRMTARDWIAGGRLGTSSGQTIEDATLDKKGAVLVRPTAALALAYVVPVADRIFVVGYHNSTTDQSTAPTMERIVGTFHVLTDQERAAAPSYPPPAPRSAESVADALADGFARLDAVLLGTVMSSCMSSGAEQAGASAIPRTVFMTQLADGFAAGLRVAVTRRPIESDGVGTFVRATWAQPGAEAQRRDLYLSRSGEVWSWVLVLTRQPAR